MKLTGYIKKIYSIIALKTYYRSNFIAPNMYLFNLKLSDLKYSRKIVFYFDSPDYMHLGDHLFFLPLIKTFIDAGYDITVIPTNIMLPLFQKLNIPLQKKMENLLKYDLVISRAELVYQLSPYKLLLVDVAKGLSLPICDQLISQFSTLFNLTQYNPFDLTVLHNTSIIKHLNLPSNKKIILFNFYCDSSSYLITKKKINTLIGVINNFANNDDYRLVLVGSKTDKDRDNYYYDFNYIDIRGQTSVLDMFALTQHENVVHYIGFDAFVMHVFSLFHKNSFVVFRGRVRPSQDQMLRKYHVHLFTRDDFVKLIEVK